jgi:RNA polymerase sigma-70 factor, ECF subfamily
MKQVGTNAPVGPAPKSTPSPLEQLQRAFHELRDELVSMLWFLLGNPDDAQDAAQDAFLKCWRSQVGLGEIRDMRAWIFRVALNVARDLQRSAWHRRVVPLGGAGSTLIGKELSPPQALEKQEAKERLRQAIMNLRREEKEVFLLRQNGGLTFEQIAAIRRSPLGTVKTQMRSALRKLRQQLT